MTWRLETSGGPEAHTRVLIQPMSDNHPNGPTYVRIYVSPWGGRQAPELPALPEGFVYRDRAGVPYTIVSGEVKERTSEDGAATIWTFEYLAAIGRHDLTALKVDLETRRGS